MIKIGVCDDAVQDKRYLAELLKRWIQESSMEVLVTGYKSGEEFFQGEGADILFLDIEMAQMDGISVKDRLQKERADTRIIFMTSHREQMAEAFGRQVFGFLSKPVVYEEMKEKLELALDDMEGAFRVIVTGTAPDRCIYTDRIAYIKANRKYCDIRMADGETLFSDRSIGSWRRELESRGFYPCHRSYLLNLYHVKKIGEEVVLLNGEKIPLSRGTRNNLREAYWEYIRKRAR